VRGGRRIALRRRAHANGEFVCSARSPLCRRPSRALGYDPGPVNGVFGAQTESAVKAFQQAREIAVDGVVGRVTWINIDEADQSHPVLKTGAAGLPVCRLQSRMGAVGFDTGGVDGRFGDKTEAAVRKLQHDFNLTVDGIVGRADVAGRRRAGE
jgi:peptidoglycan hydrolase-like protein with peptidoglycan-binding domain